MRRTFLLAAPLALTWALGLVAPLPAQSGRGAAGEPSYDVFYERLATDGDWRESADYGYVFHPRVKADWRPYTQGHWSRTDAGWTWVSTERFGWATYHYGRWARLRDVGWVWVPGNEWAPSWVSWRSSDKYVGWAPLPPEARFERSRGITVAADVQFDLGPDLYSFVEVERFASPSIVEVVVRSDENLVIVEGTRNVTNIRYANSAIFVEGPDYDVISRRVSAPFPQLRLERRTEIGDATLAVAVGGATLAVIAPTFIQRDSVRPSQLGARIERVEVERGWSQVRDPNATIRLRTKLREESPEARSAKLIPAAAPVAAPGAGATGAATPAPARSPAPPTTAIPADRMPAPPVKPTTAPTTAPTKEMPAPTTAPTNATPAPSKAPAKETPAPTKAPAKEMPAPTKAPAKEMPAPTKAPAKEMPAPTKVPVKETPAPTKAPEKAAPTKAPAIPTVAPKDVPAPSKAPDVKPDQAPAPAREKTPKADPVRETKAPDAQPKAERPRSEPPTDRAQPAKPEAGKEKPKARPEPSPTP